MEPCITPTNSAPSSQMAVAFRSPTEGVIDSGDNQMQGCHNGETVDDDCLTFEAVDKEQYPDQHTAHGENTVQHVADQRGSFGKTGGTQDFRTVIHNDVNAGGLLQCGPR